LEKTNKGGGTNLRGGKKGPGSKAGRERRNIGGKGHRGKERVQTKGMKGYKGGRQVVFGRKGVSNLLSCEKTKQVVTGQNLLVGPRYKKKGRHTQGGETTGRERESSMDVANPGQGGYKKWQKKGKKKCTEGKREKTGLRREQRGGKIGGKLKLPYAKRREENRQQRKKRVETIKRKISVLVGYKRVEYWPNRRGLVGH